MTASAGGGMTGPGHRGRRRDEPRRSIVDDKKDKALHGDFAGGERTQPMTPDAEESALLEGDFAKGERKVPLTEKEKREAEMHGDFAGGERTEPLTPESVEEGNSRPTRSNRRRGLLVVFRTLRRYREMDGDRGG